MRMMNAIIALMSLLVLSCQPTESDKAAPPTPPPVSVLIPPVETTDAPVDSSSLVSGEQTDNSVAGKNNPANQQPQDAVNVPENAVEKKNSSGTISSQGTVESKSQDSKSQYTPNDLIKHRTEDDCWLVVRGKVYDVTEFIPKHPGGKAILNGCGKDATAIFESKHGQSAKDKLPAYYIGEYLDME